MGGGSSIHAGQNSHAKSGSEPAAGDGIKSIRTTSVFKAVNFELYVKPVSQIDSEKSTKITFSLENILFGDD